MAQHHDFGAQGMRDLHTSGTAFQCMSGEYFVHHVAMQWAAR